MTIPFKRSKLSASAASTLGGLPPIQPPKFEPFPKFPTVGELIAGGHPLELVPAPPAQDVGLFTGLLGQRADVLAQHALDNPAVYPDEVKALLEELAQGTRRVGELTLEERRLLDAATLEYATYRAPVPTAKPAQKKAPTPKRPALLDEAELRDGRAPQVEEPGGVMTPYWWLD